MPGFDESSNWRFYMGSKELRSEEGVQAVRYPSWSLQVQLHCGGASCREANQMLPDEGAPIRQCHVSTFLFEAVPQPVGNSGFNFWCFHIKLFRRLCRPGHFMWNDLGHRCCDINVQDAGVDLRWDRRQSTTVCQRCRSSWGDNWCFPSSSRPCVSE